MNGDKLLFPMWWQMLRNACPGHPLSAQLVSGGFSRDQKYCICASGQPHFLLEIKPEKQIPLYEFNFMTKLFCNGLASPRAYATGSILSHGYILCSWVMGAPLSSKLDASSGTQLEEWITQAARLLASMHRVADKYPAVALNLNCAARNNLLNNAANQLIRIGEKRLLSEWKMLPVHIATHTCLLHNDFNSANILVRENGELAIIDFNRCAVAEPWQEVVRLLMELMVWRSERSLVWRFLTAYFDGQPPNAFYEALPFYIMTAALYQLRLARISASDAQAICAVNAYRMLMSYVGSAEYSSAHSFGD